MADQPITEATIDRAVSWWADLFKRADKREDFRVSLKAQLMASAEQGRFRLYVDYDPLDELLEAVRAAGIDCSGRMFSAEHLFPYKHGMWIDGPDRIKVKRGYGDAYTELAP